MKNTKLKSIVFLKNVNSNIVDEAIIILKPNIKCKEYIVEGDSGASSTQRDNDYVLNEAKLVVSNYIAKLRNEDDKKVAQYTSKIKKLKVLNAVLFIILGISIGVSIFY